MNAIEFALFYNGAHQTEDECTVNKAEINMNCHALVAKYTLIQAMHYAASAVDTLYTHPLFDMVGLAFIKISMCLTVCHLW